MNWQETIKNYYQLAKPGIIYGNALTAIAGFFLALGNKYGSAAAQNFSWSLLAGALFGISFVIGSGCVFNNYIDRGIDAKMQRTKDRALVKGSVNLRSAIIYGIILGLIGFGLLWQFTNLLTVLVPAIGFIFYVCIYGFAKRRSVYGTHIGAISGAVPPLVGYCAVAGRIDLGALLLFLALCFWQLPHFFAIGIYRQEDYITAGLPIWPIKKSVQSAKLQIALYICAFIALAVAISFFHYAGYLYLAIVFVFSLYWLWLSLKGFRIKTDDQPAPADRIWARKVFLFSLVTIAVFSVMLAVGPFLP